jgi:tRNA pseudouridine32 synthase/23S rRNA pseudouridine746 synthase
MLPNPFIAPPCHEKIKILHEDEFLLVINKPSGLLSLSGRNSVNTDSVHYRLVQDYPTANLAHRLDIGTSGLMLVALNKEVNGHITKQFQARTVEKEYVATLLGHLTDDEGVIDAPIAKAEFPRQMVCAETGKKAQSHYQVLERLQEQLQYPVKEANPTNKDNTTRDSAKANIKTISTTRVLFKPLTGRTHQLRLHSQKIGHPIIGCDLYGLTVDGIDSHLLAKRMMLHASSLSFEHPMTGERMLFT